VLVAAFIAREAEKSHTASAIGFQLSATTSPRATRLI
jgi:hypothetical protein